MVLPGDLEQPAGHQCLWVLLANSPSSALSCWPVTRCGGVSPYDLTRGHITYRERNTRLRVDVEAVTAPVVLAVKFKGNAIRHTPMDAGFFVQAFLPVVRSLPELTALLIRHCC